MASLPSLLGLTTTVRPLNPLALSSSVLLGASYFAVLPSLLVPLVEYHAAVSVWPFSAAGTLRVGVLIDAGVAAVLAVGMGVIADRVTVRLLAVSGQLLASIGWALLALGAEHVGAAVTGRVVMSLAAAALGTAGVAAMAGMGLMSSDQPIVGVGSSIPERDGLLARREEDSRWMVKSARVAGLIAAAGALGGVLGVAGWQPLLAQLGAQRTSIVLSVIAIIEGLFLKTGLKRSGVPAFAPAQCAKAGAGEGARKGREEAVWRQAAKFGLKAMASRREFGFACAASLLLKANAMVVTSLLPLAFQETPPASVALLAFRTISSPRTFLILSGLLSVPLLLLLGVYLSLPHSSFSRTRLLGASSIFAALFTGLILVLLPPRQPQDPALVYAMVMHALFLSVVGAVALVIFLRERTVLVGQEGREVGGALAGWYVVSGAAGTLLVFAIEGVVGMLDIKPQRKMRTLLLCVGVLDGALGVMAMRSREEEGNRRTLYDAIDT